MSQTEQILDEFVETQGWSDKTVLDLALTYIDNQEDHANWRDYLESLKAVDDEMDDRAPAELTTAMQQDRYWALVEGGVDPDLALRDARKW